MIRNSTRRLLHWHVNPATESERLRVCAVSYLNTVPLVWGMLHGPQQGLFDLLFHVPSVCADMVVAGQAEIGIIPVYELIGRDLATVPDVGIACSGAVRSILLVSAKPPGEIRTLAADSSSRTSVALARIILARRYGARPRVIAHAPDLGPMLERADAALIIGDPALRLSPAALLYRVLDLGCEWLELTGLPMVFALWTGRSQYISEPVARAFQESCRFGLDHLEDIVRSEAETRGFAAGFVRYYLTENLRLQLGKAEYRGLETYLRYAAELGRE